MIPLHALLWGQCISDSWNVVFLCLCEMKFLLKSLLQQFPRYAATAYIVIARHYNSILPLSQIMNFRIVCKLFRWHEMGRWDV